MSTGALAVLEDKVYRLQLSALVKLLEGEDVKAADVNAATTFCKQNKIEGNKSTIPLEKHVADLAILPEFEDDLEEDLLNGTNHS